MKDFELKLKELIIKAGNESGTIELWCWNNDISKSTISRFLNGQGNMRLSTLYRICEALDTQIKLVKTKK